VAQSVGNSKRPTMPTTNTTENLVSSPQARENAPAQETKIRSFSFIGTVLRKKGVPKTARNLILQSWRDSTKKQYDSYLKRWFKFCGARITLYNRILIIF
jgi:hypothetical protein